MCSCGVKMGGKSVDVSAVHQSVHQSVRRTVPRKLWACSRGHVVLTYRDDSDDVHSDKMAENIAVLAAAIITIKKRRRQRDGRRNKVTMVTITSR
jgi:hypothetical protein